MSRRPPGPPGRFLVGNLPDFARDILGYLSECARRYGDVVALRPTSKMAPRVDDNAGAGRGQVPQWLDVDTAGRKGTVRGLPLREDIQIPVSEQLIVELYSK